MNNATIELQKQHADNKSGSFVTINEWVVSSNVKRISRRELR
jgi:hypothetical protein